MKIATLEINGRTTAAVVCGDKAVAVAGYEDAASLLAQGESALAGAREAAASNQWSLLDRAHLRAPVKVPGGIFCVGLNFRHHILEMGRELPAHPTLFAKLPRTLAGPSDDIDLPRASSAVDYEGELVAVVGRGGRDIPLEQAHEHIAGYTLMNDVSVRDWQYRTIQWFAGKNFERSTPVGPWIVTPDELDLDRAEIEVTVNGEPRQRARLADLVFDPAQLVEDLSRITTLAPGDMIATGTPGGVGHAMDPPRYLSDGDVVDVTVDGIGTLSNRFTMER